MGITDSMRFVLAIKDALKLPPKTNRLVIEAEVGKPLMVYVRGFVPDEAANEIVKAVAEVSVSPNGDVTVTPHPVNFEPPSGANIHVVGGIICHPAA